MVFVIVPAYNEEKQIGRVIRDLFKSGFSNIIVVDDGSVDKTAEKSKTNGAVVIRHVLNRGQGASLQTGNEFALSNGAEYIVHFDGDGQFNPDDIVKALKLMKEQGVDVVLGSRFLDFRSKIPWFKKNILLPTARFINYVITGIKLSDVHNGFRIFTREALLKMEISQDKMAHNTEIILKIKKNNLSFIECPVEVVYNEYGQGISGGFKILWDLFINKFLNFK